MADQQVPNTTATAPIDSSAPRKVSHILSIGIFLMPFVFYWFLLRKGYSTKVKVIWGIWLFVACIKMLSVFAADVPQNTTQDASPVTQAVNEDKSSTVTDDFQDCDSEEAKSEIIAAMESAPLGRVYGLSVLKISKVSQVSKTKTELKCKGIAQLNNAQTYPIKYRFYKDGNDIMVEGELIGL